jgi:hypothetical protein
MPSSLADNPDLAHLFALLRMLPGPKDSPEFWIAVQNRSVPADGAPRYIFSKLTLIPRTAQEPLAENVSDLARYLLLFFGADDPELWEMLAGMFPDLSGRGHTDGER